MANCKYEKLQYQVSYDAGSTWENVTPIQVKKGDLIESPSSDCGEIETLYRWVELEGTYICDGNNKYTRRIQEESYDNGVSWYASYPTVYDIGTFVGVDEEFCADKFVGHYIIPKPTGGTQSICGPRYFWDGRTCRPIVGIDPLKVVRCNDNSTLTYTETKYYIDTYPLVSCEIGNCVTSIGSYAFSGSDLTNLVIPDSVTRIGSWILSFAGAEKYNLKLESIVIGSGVTSIGEYAFVITGNHALTSITINAATPPSITSNSFDETNYCPIYVPCNSVEVYKSASGWTRYADRIFGIQPCSNLKLYAIYKNDLIRNASCNENTTLLKSEVQPSNQYTYKASAMTTSIVGDCVVRIGNEAFSGCTSLSSITIPNTVTSIGNEAFKWCTSLSNITIPNSVTSIGDGAFFRCTSLLSITIPNNVTSIGNYAFDTCTRLSSITLPNSVTSIGNMAFEYCSSLTSVTINATTPPAIGYSVFYNTNNCPIYVPAASVDTYKSASGWSSYASRIQAIT